VSQLELQLQEMLTKQEELNRSLDETHTQRSKLQSENSSLLAQLEEAEGQAATIGKLKQQFNAKLEEAAREMEEEARQKSSLSQQLRNLGMDLEALKGQLDEEQGEISEESKRIFGMFFFLLDHFFFF